MESPKLRVTPFAYLGCRGYSPKTPFRRVLLQLYLTIPTILIPIIVTMVFYLEILVCYTFTRAVL